MNNEPTRRRDRVGHFLAHNWREITSRAALPLLTLGAMYGVYSFSRFFVPDVVAIIIAGAFEFTYIGLAVASNLSANQRRRAKFISLGAVAVSVSYNWTAGIFHVTPELFANLNSFAKWILAGLHGAPLAVLAYMVADLLLHSGVEETARPNYGLFSRKAKQLAAEAWDKVRTLEENLSLETAEKQSILQEAQQLVAERDYIKTQIADRDEIIRNGKAHNEKLIAELMAARGEIADIQRKFEFSQNSLIAYTEESQRANELAKNYKTAHEKLLVEYQSLRDAPRQNSNVSQETVEQLQNLGSRLQRRESGFGIKEYRLEVARILGV